jgi:hypothetical protein
VTHQPATKHLYLKLTNLLSGNSRREPLLLKAACHLLGISYESGKKIMQRCGKDRRKCKRPLVLERRKNTTSNSSVEKCPQMSPITTTKHAH